MSDKNTFSDISIDTVLQEDMSALENNSKEQEELEALIAQFHLSELSQQQKTSLEDMPANLLDKLYASADEFNKASIATQSENIIALDQHRPKAKSYWQPAAMAACLVLAIVAWLPQITEQDLAPELTLTQQLENLVNDSSTLSLAWTATEDAAAANASGEVIWNQNEQSGYMQFTGLDANDPSEYQYQLWIFDQSRDAEQSPAVDGGVFDISDANAETIVPINAKLAVDKPYLFAVTIERPGGVVVSARERIVVLAKNGV